MLSRFRYIDKSKLSWLWEYQKIDISSLRYIDKRKTSYALYLLGLFIMLFSSINVVYFWPFSLFCPIVSAGLMMGAMMLSNNTTNTIFKSDGYFWPTVLYLLVCFGQHLVNSQNAIPYILSAAASITLYATLQLDRTTLFKAITLICKILGGFLIISLLAFILHLIGFNLPYNSTEKSGYYFSNYYLFLLDDREVWAIIPRFHSVFLEPGHMGTAIVMLLATQIGHWKKWYNVVLIVCGVLSFSLAAYCLFVILLFLRLWIYRQKILLKIIVIVSLIAALVGGSFVYNGGDNMLNQLIVMRLTLNDAGDDIEGNNRVSNDFQKEFERYLESSDILFGRDYDTSQWGNSGYRVYIYDYGLVVLLLTIALNAILFSKGTDRRAIVMAAILAFTNFIIRGYPIMFMFLIPYYVMSRLDIRTAHETLSNGNDHESE